MKINDDDLKEFLKEHKLWLDSVGEKGTRTDLSGDDLEGVIYDEDK